jgi:hypothetical protein
MKNREVISNMALIDFLNKISNGMTGCIFEALDKTQEYKCGEYDNGSYRDCYNCIANWLNKEA